MRVLLTGSPSSVNGGAHLQLVAELAGQLGECEAVAAPVAAQGKVLAHPQLGHVQTARQMAHKLARARGRQFSGKGQQNQQIEPQRAKDGVSFLRAAEQCQPSLGHQHLARMGIKGQRRSQQAGVMGVLHQLPDEVLVADMQPVERADGQRQPFIGSQTV